jgi:hypothetical protein
MSFHRRYGQRRCGLFLRVMHFVQKYLGSFSRATFCATLLVGLDLVELQLPIIGEN